MSAKSKGSRKGKWDLEKIRWACVLVTIACIVLVTSSSLLGMRIDAYDPMTDEPLWPFKVAATFFFVGLASFAVAICLSLVTGLKFGSKGGKK